ncbi:MAG: permease prefix domain 1-containing protein [Ruminococcus sp.]|nr:permease prefix domain 1-containing protein [Ruminococcus sp.]
MEPRLRNYIENLFSTAPNTHQAYELKEEIIRNTIERYHDLLNEGKTEGDAYNMAIAGIGDINELLQALGAEPVSQSNFTVEQLEKIRNRKSLFKSLAIVGYILCIAPPIIFSYPGINILENIGAALMFCVIALSTALLIYSSMTKYIPALDDEIQVAKIRKKALMRATGVGLYIACLTPTIILGDYIDGIAFVFTLMIIAAATVLVILSGNDKTYTKADDTLVENFKEWNSQKKHTSTLYKIIVAILWVFTSLIYIYITAVLTFTYSVGAVAVTWIVFLIASALQHLIRAIFDYMEASK